MDDGPAWPRLVERAHDTVAGWFEQSLGLLTNPPGRMDATVVAGGEHGLLPPSLWWAYGLLRRGRPGDRERALAVVERVLDLQHAAPGRPWHGTWPATTAEPPPGPDAVPYVDFDPNWRAFVGAALALIDADHDLPGPLAARVRDAVVDAVESEPVDRVDPSYTNVAVLLAWLEATVGRLVDDQVLVARGDARRGAVVADTAARGVVAEHVSPTYSGITLWGVSLWAERPPTPAYAGDGAALRDAVWMSLLDHWHPGLGTLTPPLTRAYGMDMGEHLGATGPWLARLVGDDIAVPPLAADTLPQGHDLPLVFVVAELAGASDQVRDVATAVHRTTRPRRRGAWSADVGDRRWTGWTGERLAVGAESSPTDWGGWWQLVTAAAVWRLRPDVGPTTWLRLHQDGGPVDARVDVVEPDGPSESRLVRLRHTVADSPLRLLLGGIGREHWDVRPTTLAAAGRRWFVEGVERVVEVDATTAPDAVAEFELTTNGGEVVLHTPVPLAAAP